PFRRPGRLTRRSGRVRGVIPELPRRLRRGGTPYRGSHAPGAEQPGDCRDAAPTAGSASSVSACGTAWVATWKRAQHNRGIVCGRLDRPGSLPGVPVRLVAGGDTGHRALRAARGSSELPGDAGGTGSYRAGVAGETDAPGA